MSNRIEQQLEETAAIKRALGAELSAAEATALAAFERSETGRRFAKDAGELARGLASLRVVDVPTTDADFLARIRADVRGQAIAFRRGFLRFCLGVTSIAAVVGALPLLLTSYAIPIERIHDLWLLLGGFVVVVCVGMWLHTQRILSGSCALDLLDDGERPCRPQRGRLLGWFVLLVLAQPLAERIGVLWTAVAAAVTVLVFTLFARWIRWSLRRARLRKDEDAWSWWYDR